MKNVIIRSKNAGVFFGDLKERNGSEVIMNNCRRLYYWSGAASLSQLALEGVKNPQSCKFTVVIEDITILEVIEIIPCTKEAVDSINSVTIWKI